ncbi:murein hydrolase activator EnvC family protein [Pallidibacillus thermolactis]|uniref:murein hydrolase activator EnvC family protein n=1 Tax=Pallidibacillus thermolactis TaxID=251051 RepID=UPI00156AFF03|nr:peptidoglycan DD-metalloendopeptidase family protein [Pallidibacillus thermolactis]MED1672946.1 peptidoglycan DD-metalloendopeptidase family protein [Pallidibacillus thermolactis subsp. kokeshiiformis]
MKRKYFSLIGTFVLLLSTLLSSSVYAESISELEKQKQEAQQKKSQINNEKEQVKQKINKLENQQEALKAEIKQMDVEINETAQKIRETDQQIQEKNAEIGQLQNDIKETEERIAKRDELLKDRIRAIQHSGGNVSYLDVLLGSQSFTDLIGRVTAVSTIMDADKNIIEEHKADHRLLAENKKRVETERENVLQLKKQLEDAKAELEKKKDEKDKLYAQLEEEVHEHEELVMSLEEEQQLYASQEATLQKAIEEAKRKEEERRKAEEKRKAEEAKRKAEEARKAREAAKASQKSSSTSNTSNTSKPTYKAPASNGNFVRPTSGPVTSEFGYRVHPIHGTKKLHAGIDIGGATGDAVYSVADGVVHRSYFSSSYGNVVYIIHYIDGKQYETVYAHLSSRAVSEGQVVSKGQYIGGKGTTGASTGVHLHFEMHEGLWNGSKSNAVDPRKYISF